jgi:hypothetical protein
LDTKNNKALPFDLAYLEYLSVQSPAAKALLVELFITMPKKKKKSLCKSMRSLLIE